MHENPKLTIAIDGPSGSGKSSVSKEVARHFGLAYLDTGAMYRAATYRVLQLDIDLADQDAIGKAVREMPLVFGTNIKEEEILMGTTDIREEIRTERISGAVSAVASVPAVREYLIELQRWTINHAVNGIV
ncbi:MAG: (d)CMP kinase, partial [Rothia dentocariosa]